MQNLLPLILIGFFVYLIFSRKGGMGCCGSHGSHQPKRHQDGQSHSSDFSRYDHMENVIDLKKDEYAILPARNDRDPTRT